MRLPKRVDLGEGFRYTREPLIDDDARSRSWQADRFQNPLDMRAALLETPEAYASGYTGPGSS